MGILSAGLKKAAKASRSISNKDYTPPKKDINPLLKQMEEVFTTPDFIETPTDYFGNPLEPDQEVVGRFYSPVYSAIEKMPIGKEGTKGENIMGYLNKRAPNVDKSELESFNINLDPNKKYTRKEVLSLAKEKGSPDYTIERQKIPEYDDMQRQNVSDKEVDYVELTVQGKQNYTPDRERVHLGGRKNIGHTRSSIRQEVPEGGPLSQKITDRPRYLLVEEMQSDLAKSKNEPVSPDTFNIYGDEKFEALYYNTVQRDFNTFKYSLETGYDISIDSDVIDYIEDFYSAMYSPENVTDLKDIKNINENKNFKNNLQRALKEEFNVEANGKDLDTVALDAIRKSSDVSSDTLQEGLEEEADQLFKDVRNNINALYTEEIKNFPVQKLPVSSRTEYVKRLLLANIAYAKQNNINKIVIPNYKEIASQRVDTFSTVLSSRNWNTSDPLVQKYKKAREKGEEVEVAQEYFEGVFKPIYEDAVKKVLNGLKAETKGAIKTSTKELKYPDLTKPDRFRKSNALEIDITEFEYDPATSIFRFAEGGAVPMEEQMKLFEEGGLRDEGGMVDEVSGNDVPIGSTRKEVRDDIPAMLSEGEFVFPADVVRYIGLEKLMKIRQNAKQGLKKMEEMGQMGNSDEATMPDDLPFGMMDLIIVEGEEPEEKAHGGVVHMQEGGLLTSPSFTVPKFDPRNQDVRQYENAEGKKLNIPFLGGKPVYPIPEGYFPVGTIVEEEEKDETKEAIPTDDDGGGITPEPSEFMKAGGWNMDFGDPPDPNKVELWIKEAEKVSTVGNVVSGVLAAVNPILGVFTAVGNHLNKKGITKNYERALEAASKTPIKGQMDRIEKVNTRLTDPESKGILGGIVGEIIDGFSGGIGLTPEETAIAKNVSNKSIQTSIETDPNKFELDIKESLRPVARPTIEEPFAGEEAAYAYPDESLRPRARPELTDEEKFKSGDIGKSEVSLGLAPKESLRPLSKPEELKDIGIKGNTLTAEEAEVLRKAGIDVSRADPTEARRAIAVATILTDTPINSDETIQKLKRYKNKIEKPITSDTAIPPSISSSLLPPTVEEQTKEIFFGDTPVGEGMPKAPTQMVRPEFIGKGMPKAATETLTDDDMGLPTKPVSEYPFAATTATEDLKSIIDDLRNLDYITDQIKATNTEQLKSNELAIGKGKELYDKLTSSVTNLIGRNEGRSDEPEAGPSNVPTAYKAGQQRRRSTPSSSNKDDRPSLAERMQKDRGKGRDTNIKVKTDDVTIKDRTDSSGKKVGDAGYKSKLRERKEKEKAIKEGQKAGKGYEGGYGFKKGGLASRKK